MLTGDSVVSWIVWAVVLIAQQFSHGLSSRAKNSSSIRYNCVAATLSNGVWILSNFFIVSNVMTAIKTGSTGYAVAVALFYTVFCVIGSVLSQVIAMKVIEPRMEVKK